jgi:hypothetical protein
MLVGRRLGRQKESKDLRGFPIPLTCFDKGNTVAVDGRVKWFMEKVTRIIKRRGHTKWL